MAPGSLKAHVHPKCIARPALQKKKKNSRSIVTQRSSKVEANQNTTSLTKKSLQNKNTSAQSRLGEHWPLNSSLAVVLENKSAYKKRLIF